jgi:hypothetical protein
VGGVGTGKVGAWLRYEIWKCCPMIRQTQGFQSNLRRRPDHLQHDRCCGAFVAVPQLCPTSTLHTRLMVSGRQVLITLCQESYCQFLSLFLLLSPASTRVSSIAGMEVTTGPAQPRGTLNATLTLGQSRGLHSQEHKGSLRATIHACRPPRAKSGGAYAFP